MRTEIDLQNTMERYADTVTRICFVYLKNKEDSEDTLQNVFFKYYRSSQVFESEEHKKAWLIRVTINQCNDLLKSFFRKNAVELHNEFEIEIEVNENSHVREAVLKLQEKYRIPIYLHYFEGYTAVEIGEILSKKPNTIYTLLARGKEQLKHILMEDSHEL